MAADPAQSTDSGPRLEAGSPPPDAHGLSVGGVISAAGLASAVVLFVAGCLLLAKVRRTLKKDATPGAALISNQTRVTAGFSAIIVGYHLAAWSMQERWFPAPVSVQLWWLVIVIAIAAIGASVGADYVHRELNKETPAQ